MKQGLTKDWHKYWFVLQDVALLYYRDPKAESKGFLDGIIDLSLVQRVDKTELPRNFGFLINTFEGKNIIFSAITDGIRNNWITCLRKAANLPSSDLEADKVSAKRSSSFSDAPMTITTTKIVRSSTSNVLIPPKVPDAASKGLSIPKLTTTPSSSKEEEESEEETDSESEDSEEDQDSIGEPVKIEKEEAILLETEVDSLKAKLELTQNELFSLSSNLSSSSSAKASPAYDKSAYLEDELARTQKDLAKQTSEILSLKNQLSLKQVRDIIFGQ